MSRVRLILVAPSGLERMYGDGRRKGKAGIDTTGGAIRTAGMSAIWKVLKQHSSTQRIGHGRRKSEGTRSSPVQKTFVTVKEYGIVGIITKYKRFREDGKLPWQSSSSR